MMDCEAWENPGFTSCPNTGSYVCQTACGSGYAQQAAFAALAGKICNASIVVETATSNPVTASVGDCGPDQGCVDDYWFAGDSPAMGGCLTDKLWSDLGISSALTAKGCGSTSGVVHWRFSL